MSGPILALRAAPPLLPAQARTIATGASLILSLLLVSACQRPPSAPAKSARVSPPLPPFDAIDEKLCQFARERLGASGVPDPIRDTEGLPAHLVRGYVTPSGDRVRIVRQGSADEDWLEVVGANGKDGDFGFPMEVERWDHGNYLLPYRGRLYLVSFTGRQPIYLHMISRLTEDHRRAPVCLFKPKVVPVMGLALGVDPTKRAAWALCRVVEHGTASYAAERPYAARIPQTDEHFPATGGGSEAQVDVDFDNDGKVDHLIRALFASGAGAGCDSSVFLPFRGPATLARRLSEVQDAKPDIVIAPDEAHGCRDLPARWLRYDGRTFLEQRSSSYREPTDEQSEYWTVSTIAKGRARRVCEAGYVQQQPTLIARWKNGGWVPRQPLAD